MADTYESMENRELDALALRRVFDFVWPDTNCPICGWTYAASTGSCRPNDCALRTPPSRRADEPQLFATNPAASAQLRDKMRERGWLDTTQRMHSIPGMTRAEFWKEDGYIESGLRGQCLHPVDERARLTAALRALDTEAGRG